MVLEAVRNYESRQPPPKKDRITRTARYIQAAKEAERGIGSLKVGDVATASLFGIWDELSRFRHGLARDSLTTSWPETDSVGVFTSKEEHV